MLYLPHVPNWFPQITTSQVQLGGEAALLRSGRVRHVLSLPASRGVVPHVTAVAPIAVEAGRDFELAVTGSNIADEDAKLLCRMDGAGLFS